jgi:hypothetical protein
MPKLLRIVLAVVLGFVAGSIVNMGLIMISGKVIPPPAGADITTMEGLKASLLLVSVLGACHRHANGCFCCCANCTG